MYVKGKKASDKLYNFQQTWGDFTVLCTNFEDAKNLLQFKLTPLQLGTGNNDLKK